MSEYGRIHTDGSRSGGQPVLLPCPVPWCEKVNPPQVWSPDCAPMYTVDCPDCGLETDDFPTGDEAIAAWNTRQPTQSDDYTRGFIAGLDDSAKMDAAEYAFRASQPTQSDALLEGDAQTILYLLGVRHGREDERAKIAAETSQPTQSNALARCLAALDDEEVVHAIDCNKVEQRATWNDALRMCRQRITAALQEQSK